ncbi:MAG: DUF1854 domain-containing protein [Herbaspirillum sp.]
MNKFTLIRNGLGELLYQAEGDLLPQAVVPVRAFPIAAPNEGLALMSADGNELCWIDTLDQLTSEQRQLIEEELASREFLPEIAAITHVSSYATPSTWSVKTDRGAVQFVLKGEEDIRRVGDVRVLINSSHGIQFLIRDVGALDKPSRKFLDRFL